jgi:hypothetical protein
MKSNQTDANVNVSAGAGDVNGDGYSDIIVGSSLFDNVQVNEGKVFVYYGNRKTGLRSTVQQYQYNTLNIVYAGGVTGTDNSVRVSLFARSPFGNSKGRIVNEIRKNGNSFSGNPVSKSTSFSGSGVYTDLGTNGVHLNQNVTGITPVDNEFRWRARVQYQLAKNPYQRYGPWKYYSNFITSPYGGFKPKASQQSLLLTLKNVP